MGTRGDDIDGEAAYDYSGYSVSLSADGTALAVTSCDESLGAAPVLTSAKFSGTGGQLLVAFDKDTDFGWLEGEVPCDELVDFPGAADASCEWQTASVVVATLENGATVLPGDAATLVWEEIRAACPYEDDPWYCECWPAAAATSVTIAPPDEPLIPEVVVEAPRSVGVCGGLEVDAAMSSGSGGRDFTDVTWSVQFLDNTLSDENKTAMLDAVAGAAGSTLLEVPAEALAGVADTSVRFGLSLTNYLAGTGSDDAAALVSVSSAAIPEVVIVGGGSQKHASYKRLEIVAAASVSGCDGQALSTNGLTYAWSLAGFPGVQSTSVDPRRFRLDAYALSAATDYALDVTVADVAGRNNSASVIVRVGESPVEAAVDNGEFAVGNAEVFTLDASPSRDPDQTAAGVGLDYAWTTNGTVVSTAASFTVDAATLAAGRKHTFAVFVSASGNPARNDTAAAVVQVVNVASLPTVGARLLVQTPKVNPSEAVTLVGGLSHVNALDCEWVLVSGDLATASSLADAASTPTTGIAVAANTPSARYLKLLPDALTPGASYAFRLVAYDRTPGANLQGYARVDLLANAKPTSGALAVAPASGYTLETVFALTASGWVDDADDLPLSYEFYYATQAGGVEFQLKTGLSLSYDALLPAGTDLAREVVAIAYVVDQYGAKARASATAVVETRELTTAQLANLTDSLLYAAFDTGNTEAVYQTLNSAGTLLGKANCSLDCADYGREVCSAAAPDSCGACLAGTVGSAAPSTFACRSATATCSTKGATCGRDCAPCAVDEACFGDEDCDSGYCDSGLCAYPPLTCASNCTGQGFCVFVDKTAAYAELPEGLACTVADASWCQTKCVCDAGWYGDACEYDEAEYDERLSLTTTLLSGLAGGMTGQDSDAVAANQASSSLGLLTSRPCEMAESGSVGDAQSATLTLASDATTEGLVDGTADALVASLSSYVDADACPETPLRRRRLTAVRHLRSGRRLTTSSGGDATTGTVMASATDDVTEAMLLSAVPGESPVTAVSENLKLGGRRLDADAPEGEALAAPLTAAEMAAGVQAAQMALPQTSAEETANATAVDMQLAQYGANVVGSSGANATSLNFTTTPIRTAVFATVGGRRRRLSRAGAFGDARRRLAKSKGSSAGVGGGNSGQSASAAGNLNSLNLDMDGSYVFVLRRDKALDSWRGTNESYFLQCAEGDLDQRWGVDKWTGRENATCSGAAEPISLVCAGTYDELTVNCTVNTVDQCLTYDESLDYWDADLCAADIDRSNDVNITCVCPYIPPSTSFDMSASTEAVAGYYASMMADGLSPEVFTKNLLLVYTYAVIFGLTAVFLAYAVWADRKDAAANAAEVAPAADEAPLRLGDQHDFVEESMEEVVVENWGYKWYLAILDNHLHLAWLWFDEAEPRWLRVLLLPLDWVTVMFAEAVGGSYAYPTGLCDQDKFHKDPDACEGIRHPYTKDEQVCRFNLLTEQCTYVPPDTGGAWLDGSMIQVVILTTFIIVPTVKFFEWCFNNYLLAPTRQPGAAVAPSDASPEKKQAPKLRASGRKLLVEAPAKDAEAPSRASAAAATGAASIRESKVALEAAKQADFDALAASMGRHLDAVELALAKRARRPLAPGSVKRAANMDEDWFDAARAACVPFVLAVLARFQELDDAIDDAARDASDAKQSQKLARQLKRVRRKLASDYPGRDKVGDGVFVKACYRACLRLHAQACEWEPILLNCATTKDCEKQMLVFTRLEVLDPVQDALYRQLYEVDFSAEEEAEPVERWQKAACAIALFFLAIYLMWWTLAYTLSVRNTPGAGASAVRLWWRMTMFAQIITIVVFEPLEILVLNVFLPGALSPVMKHKGDPAATVDFPYRTPLADRASALLLRRHPAKAPAMASRIDYRDASSALRDRRTTVRNRARREAVLSNTATGTRLALESFAADGRHKEENRQFRARCARWDPAEIESISNRTLFWRQPLYAAVFAVAAGVLIILQEDVQGAVIDEMLVCVVGVFFLIPDITLPKTFWGTLGLHAGFMMFLFVALLNPIRCLCRKKKKKETGRKRRASDAKNSPRTEAVLRAAGVDVGAGDLGVSREFVDWAAARKITPLQRRVRDIKAKRAKP
ncbi:ribosome binding protein [Aureococcus anophagefferens]|uniref:Ribosome binding protein n=1 Tax=Aureococcus anophagefferens TaxID=44056 RepID=A0ABR1FR20_AURAN